MEYWKRLCVTIIKFRYLFMSGLSLLVLGIFLFRAHATIKVFGVPVVVYPYRQAGLVLIILGGMACFGSFFYWLVRAITESMEDRVKQHQKK